MMSVIIENMTPPQRRKNLLSEEKENTPQEETPSTPKNIESFLSMMRVDWEQKGRAYYIYPSSLNAVKEILTKIPSPQENQYAIIPLGQASGYSVFIMVTKSGISIRIGYGKNSIPYISALNGILEKVGKIAKELGLETRKNGKNLLE